MHYQTKKIWGMVFVGLVITLAIVAYVRLENQRERAKLQAAMDALERRDFTEASRILDDYLSRDPEDNTARLLAAQAARRQGKSEEMSRHLREFVQNGGSPKAADLEASLHRVQQGDLREAPELYSRYLAQRGLPESALAMEALLLGSLKVFAPPAATGVSLTNAGAPPEVNKLLQAADLWLHLRTSKADQVEGRFWRGRIFGLANNQPSAVADFRAALELDPHHAQARLFLAIAISQSAPQETASHLRILDERLPPNPYVQYSLATVNRMMGNLPEARRLLELLLTNDPKNVQALLELGLIDLDEHRLKEAGHHLRRAYALAPQLPETNYALSRWLLLLGKSEEAKPYLDQFRQLEAARKPKN